MVFVGPGTEATTVMLDPCVVEASTTYPVQADLRSNPCGWDIHINRMKLPTVA